MDIQKVFNAVTVDEMNSPISSIVYELEQQGYKIKLEGVDVTAGDMEDKMFEDLGRATNEFEIELLKESEGSQKFKLVFTDYHKFNFQAC
jgi:hypothetical protein